MKLTWHDEFKFFFQESETIKSKVRRRMADEE